MITKKNDQASSIKYSTRGVSQRLISLGLRSAFGGQVSNKRLIAVGDIHGQFKMLKFLMKKVKPDKTDKFVFLGDYIDRGLQSKEVIDFLIDFSKVYDCVFLRGNHEDMLLAFLKLDEKAMYGESYQYNGGEYTAFSYAGDNAVLEDLKLTIPEEHIEFLKSLKYYHIEDNFLFVHAGIMPGILIEEQKLEDLVWIREQFFYYPTGIDKIIVFGHTPLDRVLISDDKIGLDTGAGYFKTLSAIELNTKEVYSVKWSEVK